MCHDFVNSARWLRLGKFRLLPSTVIIQTGYQKGEGYAKNIPAFWQAQQLYKSNILSDYWKQNLCFYLALSMFNISLNSITYYSHFTLYTCHWLIQVFWLVYHTSWLEKPSSLVGVNKIYLRISTEKYSDEHCTGQKTTWSEWFSF